MQFNIENKKGKRNFKKIKNVVNSMPSAVILSTQRSGSTLLCDYLHQKGFGKPDEHILKMMSVDDLEEFERGDSTFFLNRFSIDEYINLCIHGGVFCTKIMSNHVIQLTEAVCRLYKNTNKLAKYISFFDIFSDSIIVLLRRRDFLKQAISRHFSANTGVCHEIATDNFYFNGVKNFDLDVKARVIYSFRNIEKELQAIDYQNSCLDVLGDFARKNEHYVIDMVYEDFVSSGYVDSYIDDALKVALLKYNLPISKAVYTPSLKMTSSIYSGYMELVHKRVKSDYFENMTNDELLLLIIDSMREFRELDPAWFDIQISYIMNGRYA